MIVERLRIVSLLFASLTAAVFGAIEPINVGWRHKVNVDQELTQHLSGTEWRLHHPVSANLAFVPDPPREGNRCAGFAVLHDIDLYRVCYSSGNETRLTENPPGKHADKSRLLPFMLKAITAQTKNSRVLWP
jgi:hypothetical protein